MFVRTKKFTDRTVLQIVKSVRDGNKVRQKVVRHVGTATSEEQLIQLSKFGQLIIEEMKQADSAQTHLFTPKQYAELLEQNRNARQKPVPERVKLKHCREESRIALGLREVMAEIYRLLGWEQLLGGRRIKANRILQELVLARIAQPLSKRATVRELDRFGDLSLNLEQVYNTMDDLNDNVIESICQQSHEMVKKIYTEPIEVIFYDTTTLYFESECSDSLREKGYSKDGKHHRVQLVFALLTTQDGMPVGYQIFPGSMYEGHTLSESFDQLRKRFAHAQFTLVADAGMINKDNQKWLEDNGIAYVMGARLKSQSESFQNQVLKADDFKPWGDSVPKQADVAQYKVLCQNGRQVIVAPHSGPTLTVEDDRRDYGEKRCITVGFLDGAMVVLVWTSRGNAYRIISLRKDNERERQLYAQDFDPNTAPDLSKDGWPEKFSKTAVRRGRPLSENPKVSTTIRLSQDVIDHFRAGGRGWQTRVGEALRDWINRQDVV